MSECEHNYQHQGEVCWPSEYPMPGSGAHHRYYATAYFCTKCLSRRLMDVRIDGHTYLKTKFNAVELSQRPKEADNAQP